SYIYSSFFSLHSRSPTSTLFPCTTLFRSVIFITHNPHHAYPIGDHFTLLNRGRSLGTFAKSEISREELTSMMAGGEELDTLSHRSEEHTSELESLRHLVCRLLLEKKKNRN